MDGRPLKGILVFFNNCNDPAKDEEYNRWYNETHIPDVLGTGAVHSPSRWISEWEHPGQRVKTRFMAIYETDQDPRDALAQIQPHSRRWQEEGRMHPNMADRGFMLLSLAIESASGQGFHQVLQERVLDPAGMVDTAFLRSDELPPRAAVGYLKNGRTNVFHLPVRGAGDGGVYSTVTDSQRLWKALFDGSIVSTAMAERMVEPRGKASDGAFAYGLGFWLRTDSQAVMLEGMDAGVSFRSVYDRSSDFCYTVISNTSTDVWALARYLDSRLAELAP